MKENSNVYVIGAGLYFEWATCLVSGVQSKRFHIYITGYKPVMTYYS